MGRGEASSGEMWADVCFRKLPPHVHTGTADRRADGSHSGQESVTLQSY